jgi:hypothetical protein
MLPLNADDSDVTDQPIRMHVRGSSSAVEYAKKSFSLDPVDQITNFTEADTDQISFLGGPHRCAEFQLAALGAACFCATGLASMGVAGGLRNSN